MMGTGRRTRPIIGAIILVASMVMSGVPAIIAVILAIIYTVVTRRPKEKGEGRATNYPPCPGCGLSNWVPKSRAEIVNKFMDLWVRQYFDCAQCNIRCRLIRRSDSEWWTFSQAHFV